MPRHTSGEIGDFTGISSPYEPPERAELAINAGALDVEQSLEEIVEYFKRHFPI